MSIGRFVEVLRLCWEAERRAAELEEQRQADAWQQAAYIGWQVVSVIIAATPAKSKPKPEPFDRYLRRMELTHEQIAARREQERERERRRRAAAREWR